MKKLRKLLLREHHNSLDAPVFVWMKIHEGGDLSWLLVKKRKLKNGEEALLAAVWEGIYSEYVEVFGWSEEFLSIHNKAIEIAKMKRKSILNKDRSQETFIEIEEIELEEMKKTGLKATFMDTKIAIESQYKFQVNLHSTSIREFYSYLKHLPKAA